MPTTRGGGRVLDSRESSPPACLSSSSPPQSVTAGASTSPAPSSSRLSAPAVSPSTGARRGPLRILLLCLLLGPTVPLQHLSSIATGSADPSGLRLAPSLGGGKQALPYFAALDCVSTCCFSALLLCQQFSPNPSLWVGYSNTTLLRFVLPRLFFLLWVDVLLNPRTLVPHVETCSATRGVAVAVALPSLLWSGRVPCRAGRAPSLRIHKNTATWLCFLRSHVLTLDGTLCFLI